MSGKEMNVQRIHEPPPIHGVIEVLEDKGVAVSYCGQWLNWDNFKVVTEEVTCKRCLERMPCQTKT